MLSAHPSHSHSGVRLAALPVGFTSGAAVADAVVALVAAGALDLPLADTNGVVRNCPGFDTAPAMHMHFDLALEPPALLPDPSDAEVFYPSRTVLRGYIGICDAAAHGEDVDSVVRASKDFVADVHRLHKQHGPPTGGEPIYRILIFHAGERLMDRAGDLGPWARFVQHALSTATGISGDDEDEDEGEGGHDGAALITHLTVLMCDVAASVLTVLDDEIDFYSAGEEGGGGGSAGLTATPDAAGVHAVFSMPQYAGNKTGGLELGCAVGATGALGSLMGGGLKRRIGGRLLKRKGDIALLAGSPLDAVEWLDRAVRALKASGDALYHGLALESLAAAMIAKVAVGDGRDPRHPTSVAYMPEVAGMLKDAVAAFDTVASTPEYALVGDAFHQLAIVGRMRLVRYIATSIPAPAVMAMAATAGVPGEGADGILYDWWMRVGKASAGDHAATPSHALDSPRGGGGSHASTGTVPTSVPLLQAGPVAPRHAGHERVGSSGGAADPSSMPTPSSHASALSMCRRGGFAWEADSKDGELTLCKLAASKGISGGGGDGASPIATPQGGGGTPLATTFTTGGGGGTPVTNSGGVAWSRFTQADVVEALNGVMGRLREVRNPQSAVRLWAQVAEMWELTGYMRKADACVGRLCKVLRSLQPVPAVEHFLLPAGYTSPARPAAGGGAPPLCGCVYHVLQTSGSCMVAGGQYAERQGTRVIPWPLPWFANSDIHPATSPFRFVPALSSALLALAMGGRDPTMATMLLGDTTQYHAMVGSAGSGREGAVGGTRGARAAWSMTSPTTWLGDVVGDLWSCGELPLMRGVLEAMLTLLPHASDVAAAKVHLPANSASLGQLTPATLPQHGGAGAMPMPTSAAKAASHFRPAALLAAERTAFSRLRNRRLQMACGAAGIVVGSPLPLLRLLLHRTTIHHALTPLDAALALRLLWCCHRESVSGMAHLMAHRGGGGGGGASDHGGAATLATSTHPHHRPASTPSLPVFGLVHHLMSDPCGATTTTWDGGSGDGEAAAEVAGMVDGGVHGATPTLASHGGGGDPATLAATLRTGWSWPSTPLKYDADLATAKWAASQLHHALQAYLLYSAGGLPPPPPGHNAAGLVSVVPRPLSSLAAHAPAATGFMTLGPYTRAYPAVSSLRIMAAGEPLFKLARQGLDDPITLASGGMPPPSAPTSSHTPVAGRGTAGGGDVTVDTVRTSLHRPPWAGCEDVYADYVMGSVCLLRVRQESKGHGGSKKAGKWSNATDGGVVIASPAASPVAGEGCVSIRGVITATVPAPTPLVAHVSLHNASALPSNGTFQLVLAIQTSHGGKGDGHGWRTHVTAPVGYEIPALVRTIVFVPLPHAVWEVGDGEATCWHLAGAIFRTGLQGAWAPFITAEGAHAVAHDAMPISTTLTLRRLPGLSVAVAPPHTLSADDAGAGAAPAMPVKSARHPPPVVVYGSVWVPA